MRVIRSVVAGKLLPGRSVDRVNITAAAEVLFDSFRDRPRSLDVFKNRLAPLSDANGVVRLSQSQLTTAGRQRSDAE